MFYKNLSKKGGNQMFEKPCITQEEVERLMNSEGYRIGYKKVFSELSHTGFCVFYYKGHTVVRCKYMDLLLDEFVICNEFSTDAMSFQSSGKISLHDLSYQQLVAQILQAIQKPANNKPTILSSFSSIIFQKYDNSTEKYQKYVIEMKEFTPEFASIYAEEFAMLQPADVPAATISDFDCFIDKGNNYWYVQAADNSSYILSPLFYDIITNEKIVEIRELTNNMSYQKRDLAEVTSEYVDDFYGFLSCFRSVFGGQRRVAGLPDMPENLKTHMKTPVLQKLVENNTTCLEYSYRVRYGRHYVKIIIDACMAYISVITESFNDSNWRPCSSSELERKLKQLSASNLVGLLTSLYKRFLSLFHVLGLEGWMREVINCYQALICNTATGYSNKTFAGEGSSFEYGYELEDKYSLEDKRAVENNHTLENLAQKVTSFF